jgi:hypothetical protein
MDLLIHVGLHKTGTTSVQRGIFEAREELKDMGILYPSAGLVEAAHHLFPGCLIPNHQFLNHKSPGRSLVLGDYVSAMLEETRACGPNLVVLSSEVFSEALHLDVIGMVGEISSAFDSTRLLLSTRDADDIALSALKHMIREGGNFGSYAEYKRDTARVLEFWSNCGIGCIQRRMEENDGDSLALHYFGDVFRSYDPRSEGTLSRMNLHLNGDGRSPSYYLFRMMAKNLGIADPGELECDEASVTNENLKRYLDCAAEAEDIYLWAPKHGGRTRESILSAEEDALSRSGMDAKSVDAIMLKAKELTGAMG